MSNIVLSQASHKTTQQWVGASNLEVITLKNKYLKNTLQYFQSSVLDGIFPFTQHKNWDILEIKEEYEVLNIGIDYSEFHHTIEEDAFSYFVKCFQELNIECFADTSLKTLSFMIPIIGYQNDYYAQARIYFGPNLDWIQKIHIENYYYNSDESLSFYKRLLLTIATSKSKTVVLEWDKYRNPLTWQSFKLSPYGGLFRVVRSKKGKTGNILKSPKIIEEQLVTSDFSLFVESIFGNYDAEKFDSFSEIIEIIGDPESYVYPYRKEIIKNYEGILSEKGDYPISAHIDLEEVLA
jgi:hypothetical protein